LLGYTVLFWGAVAFVHVFVDVIPGKTGWGQALLCAIALVLVWAGWDWIVRGDPLDAIEHDFGEATDID